MPNEEVHVGAHTVCRERAFFLTLVICCTKFTHATVARHGMHTNVPTVVRVGLMEVSAAPHEEHLSIADHFHVGVRSTRPKVNTMLWLCKGRAESEWQYATIISSTRPSEICLKHSTGG